LKKEEFISKLQKIKSIVKNELVYSNIVFDEKNLDFLFNKHFSKKISILSILSLSFLIVKNIFIYIAYILVKSQYFNKNIIKKSNKKIIIIGHKINNDTSIKDFYFSKLINFLEKNKVNYSLYKINHLKKNFSKNKNIIQTYMNFIDEVSLFCKLFLKIFVLIKILTLHNKNNFYFNLFVCGYLISNDTAHNIRIPIQISKLLNHKNETKLFTTFEGYHWERVLFGLIANLNYYKKIKIYATQHSFISNKNLNFYNFNNKLFNPSYVLLSGLYLKKKLIKNFSNNLVIGNLKNNMELMKKNSSISDSIIFLPSSNLIEIDALLSVLEIIYQQYPNYNYIWRSHPYQNENKISSFLKKYPNVEISSNDLHYDLSRSKLAFYSISSSIIFGLTYGIRPIFVKLNYKNIDSIEDIKSRWKCIFNDDFDLKKEFAYEKDKFLLDEQKKTKMYYSKYFEIFDEAIAMKIINE